MDNKKALELLAKVKELKDLREAIDLMHSEGLSKGDPAAEMASAGSGGEIRHLGVHELSPGILTHVMGTGDKDTHHYHCHVNLKALSEGTPHISVSIVDHAGRVLGHAPKVFGDIKDAVGAVVRHFNKREWSDE